MRDLLRRLAPVALILGLPATAGPAQEARADRTAARRETTEPAARPAGGWWMRRHEQLVGRARRGDATLIFVGDSITQGWETAGKDTWERFYKPRRAANLGVGGDRTQHVLWRLDHGEVDGLRPEVAVLLIGANNLGSDSNDDIVEGIRAVVARLRSRLPDTRVLVLGIFRIGEKPSDTRERIKAINRRVAGLADGRNVRFLDPGGAFVDGDGRIAEELMDEDFVHPSRRGYRLWADAMEPTLWEMMGAGRASLPRRGEG